MFSLTGTSLGDSFSDTLAKPKVNNEPRVDEGDDDSEVSTCAPTSASLSVQSTPFLGPSPSSQSVDDVFFMEALDESASIGTGVQSGVCIIHHNDMQLHAPPRASGIFELPRRVIAIENGLKGIDVYDGCPKRNWGNAPMRFLRSADGRRKRLVMAYGSPAPKKRRMSHSSGPSSTGSAWDACRIVEAPLVDDSDLLLVHSKQHLRKVRQLCEMAVRENSAFFPLSESFARRPRTKPQALLNDDVYYSPQSLAAMRRAAGGAVEAVRQLFSIDSEGRAAGRSEIRSSFAIVRPPGHHCCGDPNGFCFFNNTAVAASHARAVLGLPRVAIVDWDYHHGDGQQKLFYDDPTILTISLHVAMERNGKGADTIAFPSNMGMDLNHNGCGPGLGYNINIPWPHDKVGAHEYQEAFRTVVVPALQAFDPDLILVACGFDAIAGDTLAGTNLPPSSYFDMTTQLLALEKPLAVILEGGYSPKRLAMGSLNVVHALLGRSALSCASNSASDSASDSASGSEESDSTKDGVEEEENFEASLILEALRQGLNTLPPWSKMSSPGRERYFKESSSPAYVKKSFEAAARLTKLIKEQA